MFWTPVAKAGSPKRAVPREARGEGGELVPTPDVSAGAPPVAEVVSNGDRGGRRLPTEVTALGLGLPGDGVHDGILGVHADGGVVLRVDDGGLAAQPLHLDGLVGGQGRVLQGVGVEALLVVGTGGGEQVERSGQGGEGEKGNRSCYLGGSGQGGWWRVSRKIPKSDPRKSAQVPLIVGGCGQENPWHPPQSPLQRFFWPVWAFPDPCRSRGSG